MNISGSLKFDQLRGPKLNQFWIRSLGMAKEISRLKPLAQLTREEKLFAALLRGDRQAAIEVLVDETRRAEILEQVVRLTRLEAFSSLIYERIFALELSTFFNATPPAPVVTEVFENTPLSVVQAKAHSLESVEVACATYLEQIKERARFAVANHFRLDEKFASVLKITKAFQGDALWVKGAHLSRSVYQPAHFRHYGDLDVIVHPNKFEAFVQALTDAGFASFDLPAHCNQIGVGPVNRPVDIITSPLPDWIPSGAITMHRAKDKTFVDIKVGPFERGVQAVELERIFAQAEECSCLGEKYRAPTTTDHLMLMLCNFAKNRFDNWRTLYDIHLLARSFSDKLTDWELFVERCKIESISTIAWVGLSVAADRLGTLVPDSVLAELSPEENFSTHCLTFTVSPAFVWNSTGLPMKLLNIFISPDWKRKLKLLACSFVPSSQFLRSYYGNGSKWPSFVYFVCLPMHWYVLLMPGGLVRRTIGPMWWSTKPGF